jgi:hypothetical protein
LEPRNALVVPGDQRGHATDVRALLAHGLDAAEDHVLDFAAIEPAALGERLEHRSSHP